MAMWMKSVRFRAVASNLSNESTRLNWSRVIFLLHEYLHKISNINEKMCTVDLM